MVETLPAVRPIGGLDGTPWMTPGKFGAIAPAPDPKAQLAGLMEELAIDPAMEVFTKSLASGSLTPDAVTEFVGALPVNFSKIRMERSGMTLDAFWKLYPLL